MKRRDLLKTIALGCFCPWKLLKGKKSKVYGYKKPFPPFPFAVKPKPILSGYRKLVVVEPGDLDKWIGPVSMYTGCVNAETIVTPTRVYRPRTLLIIGLNWMVMDRMDYMEDVSPYTNLLPSEGSPFPDQCRLRVEEAVVKITWRVYSTVSLPLGDWSNAPLYRTINFGQFFRGYTPVYSTPVKPIYAKVSGGTSKA